MLYPPVNELIEKTGTRYSLVITTARRARQLIEGEMPLVAIKSNKAISIAAAELYQDKLTIVPLEEYVKPEKPVIEE